MDELFPVESVSMESPRLAWMKKWQVIAARVPGTEEWLAGFVAGKNYADIAGNYDATVQWFCNECGENGGSAIGTGETEDEAIGDLMTTWYARSNNIRLWN